MSSFFELGLDRHLGRSDHLSKIDTLLDWGRLSSLLSGDRPSRGRTGYDPVQLLKCLLLQSWHGLSDPGLEQSLRVRLDFLRFTGFGLGESLPDETTLCRFRNKLVKRGAYSAVLREVNRQLESHGLKVKQAEAAIVDATLIRSAARPRRTLETTGAGTVKTKLSADADATWKTKGNRHHFGYQGFARCDEAGFIDKTRVTPANLAETKEPATMTEGLRRGVRVKADKGFFGAANKEMLKSRGLKNGLMYKALRNRPTTQRMKAFNKPVSRTRWRIEQCFGTIKRRFRMTRASYFTRDKVDAQFAMKAICLNLLKAVNKVILT